MSLTATDLQEIGNVIESALSKQTREIIEPLQGEIRALSNDVNDVKEIYTMISVLQSKDNTDIFL